MPTIKWILIMTKTVLRGLVDWIPRLLPQALQSSFPPHMVWCCWSRCFRWRWSLDEDWRWWWWSSSCGRLWWWWQTPCWRVIHQPRLSKAVSPHTWSDVPLGQIGGITGNRVRPKSKGAVFFAWTKLCKYYLQDLIFLYHPFTNVFKLIFTPRFPNDHQTTVCALKK